MIGLLKTTDIYLIDQILKGRFEYSNRVVDLGCGGGRNLPYFLKNNFDVYGIDEDEEKISATKELVEFWNPNVDMDQFQVRSIENHGLPKGSFDLVICNAVLHFANNQNHFEQMLKASFALLKPGGLFFARLATDIGIEHLVKPLSDGRYLLPDESERYLVNQNQLITYTKQLNAYLVEPIKTTNVQNLRCMTTWCMTV
ncbi:MAG: class I SAM-dependent methyltransferase [Saprospiraceae bacterium]